MARDRFAQERVVFGNEDAHETRIDVRVCVSDAGRTRRALVGGAGGAKSRCARYWIVHSWLHVRQRTPSAQPSIASGADRLETTRNFA
jgi:hypothetical protein